MQKNLIYELMNGNIDTENISMPEDITIEGEFQDDSECCMSEISKILSFKMVDYGQQNLH